MRGPSKQPSSSAEEDQASADSLLLVQIRAEGARSAASQIYRRFSGQVNGTIWRLLGADAEHDDLVNDAFLRIIGGIDNVREADRLAGWVGAVTVNLVRDELRKRAKRRKHVRSLGPQEAEQLSTDGPDHEGRRLVERTFAILSRLATDDRLAFSLRYIEQRTLPETAKLCACSLATVKRRIARAKKKFRQLAANDPDLAERLGAGDEDSETA